MIKKYCLTVTMTLAALVLTTTDACAQPWDLSGLPVYSPKEKVSGTIRVHGNNGQETVMKYWAEGFRRYQPEVQFEVKLLSTALALPALCSGVADIGLMGREIWPMELLAVQRVFKNPPVTIEVSTCTFDKPFKTYPLVIFVHKDNPLSRITMEQLDGIFGSLRSGGWDEAKINWMTENGRGADKNIRTWGQMGLTGEWKDKTIQPYGFDFTRNGLSTYFAERVFHGGDKWNEALIELSMGKKADGSMFSPQEQSMEALGKDRYGIAYNGMQYRTSLVKPLALAWTEAGPYVEATKASVQDRSYPFIRSMWLHAIRENGKALEPRVREFIRYILSREGQEAVVREGDYLPLTEAVVRKQLRIIE
ncbi:MAG: substrate-binding domain-containing protein [Opitutaceae bacterium]|nr:substrate-binding domain-containing protein [Opitutaceae bacterium]